MVREIGSEFYLDNNTIIRKNSKLPEWLSIYDNVVLTSSGRGALSLLLKKINLRVKKVLLPSYICQSVITSFESNDFEIVYYNINKNLYPSNIELIKNSDASVFLHMGYYGFSTNKHLSEAISTLKSRSVIIIEDVTHSLFSKQNNIKLNDHIFGSIRKWFGIPSGGFFSSKSITDVKILDNHNEFINKRITSLKLKYNYIISGKESLKSAYLLGFSDAEHILDKDDNTYRIDDLSELIIKNFNFKELCFSRQRNYNILLKHLKDFDEIEVLFSNLNNNITPMFFPIYVKTNRDELRHKLIQKKIYCPIHWPVPNQVKEHLDDVTKDIYDSILSIPCDQRYKDKDMIKIIKEIERFYKK